MATWQNDAEIFEGPDWLAVKGKSRFPTPYSNAVLPLSRGVQPSELFEHAESMLGDRRYFVWTRNDGSDLGEALRERGFTPADDLPALVIDEPVVQSSSPDVDVRKAESEPDVRDFVRVAELAYAEIGLPEGLAPVLLARPRLILTSSTVAVARVGGAPVAAALSIVDSVGGNAGVYWVGAVPEARRRGAGQAVTRMVTNAAFEQGAKRVTLEASRLGEPVYRRMGYRETGRYLRFLSPSRKK